MISLSKSSFTETLFFILALTFIASPVLAIPPDPDNAALLYYQGFLTLAQLSDEARDRISHVATGETAPDDQVREDISKCVGAIEFAEAAVEVPGCHWGVRYSQGFEALMPQLARMRFLAFVLIADARIHAADGNYRAALERCLMAGTFARHVGDDTLISYLVSIAVRDLEYKCMRDIMGRAASDAELLRWLKNELAASGPVVVSPVRPMKIEIEIVNNLMQMENIEKLARVLADSDEKKVAQIVEGADEKSLERARRIYSERMNSALTVLSTPMPYEQAHSRLKRLADFDQDDPVAMAAKFFTPALDKVLSQRTGIETHANAIKTAIDVLLIHAGTGRLPDALPSGLPQDVFSGKDFEYEKTKEGFILRCRAKSLVADKIQEYEFKIKQ